MIVTFCGHRNFVKTKQIEGALIDLLEDFAAHNRTLDCYCGGYGSFDGFTSECVKKVQERYSNVRNCLVIPYMTLEYQERVKYLQDYYDEIIYPPLENVPKKFAILRRNEWMVDHAGVVIAYVLYSWGGAAHTLEYAKKKRAVVYSLHP